MSQGQRVDLGIATGPVEFGNVFAGQRLKINEKFGRRVWEHLLPDDEPARILLEKEMN